MLDIVAYLPPDARRLALARGGLTETALADGALRVPQDRYRALFDAAVREGDDELFGFLQRPVPRGTFATLVRTLARCRTAGDAVHVANDLYGLFDRHRPWRLSAGRGRVTLELVPRTERQAASAVYNHQMLRAPLYVIGWLVGHRLRADQVLLDRRLESFAGETAYLLGAMPRLSDRSAWTVPAAVLDLPIVRRPADVDGWLRASLASIIGPPGRTSIEERVRRVLSEASPIGAPDLISTARALRMSRATLARRLHQAGRTFRELKDAVRHELAVAELARPDGTVESVAVALGFSDVRSFRRAFSRWTGAVPSAYRPGGSRREAAAGPSLDQQPRVPSDSGS